MLRAGLSETRRSHILLHGLGPRCSIRLAMCVPYLGEEQAHGDVSRSEAILATATSRPPQPNSSDIATAIIHESAWA